MADSSYPVQSTVAAVGSAALLALSLLGCRPGPEAPLAASPSPSPAASAKPVRSSLSKDYQFTNDWFTHNIPVWTRLLGPLKGKPDLRYLEVGVYEGWSFLWVLENVLTHPTSHLTGIDIEISPLLRANIEKSGQAGRVTLLEGTSQAELRKLPDESFDIIYVDGSHTADDVLADAVMSWQLVRPGGIVIYDDYLWDGSEHTQRGGLAGELTPSPALNAFYSAYIYQIEVAHSGYQLAFRKVANPCGPIKSHCSPFGQYLYDWREGRLLLPATPPKPVPVTAEERDLIEAILKSRGVGAERQRAYGALRDRIGLRLPRRFDFGSAPAGPPAP